MVKRLFDFLLSLSGLIVTSPLLLVLMFLVWRTDRHSPFYVADRMGKSGDLFRMVKMRSMVINADSSGVDSTSANDDRITPVGHFIRRFKIDELTQLWNVLLGDMSLVGPRPNVKRETDLYTSEERKLLTVRPGITDLSSIVFSDEGEILAGKEDPDLSYNQLIRPWKSRLGLIYVANSSLLLDIQIIFITIVAIVDRDAALRWVGQKLAQFNVDERLAEVVERRTELTPYPPPGSDTIVESR